MASVILGDWTHRRGDAGGARAVAAEMDRPRPSVAWSWQPEHGGRVDQVRVAGTTIVVATMMPRDPKAARWEHAVLYALDGHTGIEIARRVLPDPVPVAAMVVEDGIVHVISTRSGEPIFWYALTATELVPDHRRIVTLADGVVHDDVLEAWATPDGGLWLELDTAGKGNAARLWGFAFADPNGSPATAHMNEDLTSSGGSPIAHDACAGGNDLFVPLEGRWARDSTPTPPGLSRLGRGPGREAVEPTWVLATVMGPRSSIHALGGDGVVCAVAVAEDEARPDHARVEVFAVDRTSGTVRWRAQDDRPPSSHSSGTPRGRLGARTGRSSSRASGPTERPVPLFSAPDPTGASTRSCSARAAATCSTPRSAIWCSRTGRTARAASR